MNEDLVVTEFYAIYPFYILMVAERAGRNCFDLHYVENDEEEENSICAICNDPFQFFENVALTRCLHVFHIKCVNGLIVEKYRDKIARDETSVGIFLSPTCPECRHQLDVEAANTGERGVCFRGFLENQEIQYPRLLPRYPIMNDDGVVGRNHMVHALSYGQEYVYYSDNPRIDRRPILLALQMGQEPVNPQYYPPPLEASPDRNIESRRNHNQYFTRADVIAYYNRSQPRAAAAAPASRGSRSPPRVAAPAAPAAPAAAAAAGIPVLYCPTQAVRGGRNLLNLEDAKQLCRRNVLSVSGNKRDICNRLQTASNNRGQLTGLDGNPVRVVAGNPPVAGAAPRAPVPPRAPAPAPAAPRAVPPAAPAARSRSRSPVAAPAAGVVPRRTQVVPRAARDNQICLSRGGFYDVNSAKQTWRHLNVGSPIPTRKGDLCKGLSEKTAISGHSNNRIFYQDMSNPPYLFDYRRIDIPTYAEVYNRLNAVEKAANRNLQGNPNPAYQIANNGPYDNGL
jgi:hypothetical protein